MSYAWAPYQPADHCEGHAEPGAVAMLVYLLDSYPYCRSLGIYNCRNSTGGSTLSHHAEGRAYDNGVPTDGGASRPELGDPVVRLLGPHGARLGIDHLIWNRTVWSARSPAGRPYTGVHPHYDHHHIGLTRAAAVNLTYGTLVSVLGPPGALPIKGEALPALPLRYGMGYNPAPADADEDIRGTDQSFWREQIRDLQTRLNRHSQALNLDGLYGPATVAAAKAVGGAWTGHPQGALGRWWGGNQNEQLDWEISAKASALHPGPAGPRGPRGLPGIGERGPKGDPGEPGKGIEPGDTLVVQTVEQ